MLRAALLLSLMLCAPTAAFAQEGAPKASYTLDEYVEARRPVIVKRKLTNEEKSQAAKLVSEINGIIKKKGRPPHALLEQLAPLAESGDRGAMKAMMVGYGEAGEITPWPADATSLSAWAPNYSLAGLWAMMLWKDGDHGKDIARGVDNCWSNDPKQQGKCGYTISGEKEYSSSRPFSDYKMGKGPEPKNVVFTEKSLALTPEQEKARYDKFVASVLNGGIYTMSDLTRAEVWAKRAGGDNPNALQDALRKGSDVRFGREANQRASAKADRDAAIALWQKLQGQRVDAKARSGALAEKDEAEWVRLSHDLSGKYLVPFASENVLFSSSTIDSLCNEDSGAVCQKQKQLYQYREDAARSARQEREMAMRNLTMGGGGDVSVRTYDSSGNYLGTTTMPRWQADIVGAH